MNKETGLALDTLKSAQKLEPESGEVQIALSRHHAAVGELKEAQAVLAGWLGKHPDDLEARVERGDLFARSGDFRRAEAEYGLVKKRAPGLPIAYARSGALYLKQGKTARAVAEYEKAYRLNEGSWSLANDLAYLLAETATGPADLDRALALAEKARSLNPEAVVVLDTLGWLQYKRGEAEKAVSLLRQVQSRQPESAETNYHLGMALYKAGKLPEAKEKLAKSLSGKGAFPGRDEAARTLAGI